jgi:nicotinamide mononucleotide transporter
MPFFDIHNVVIRFGGYDVSYVELIGSLFGLISVYLASKINILTWVTGLLNEMFLFILFYQLQLYADMFLQIYFFAVSLYGWYYWKYKATCQNVTTISINLKIGLGFVIVISSILVGWFFSNIHLYFPYYFNLKADYPFLDSMVMILSIVATVLLARKKLETWYLWILVDLLCIGLFYKKGAIFLTLEYFIFLIIAVYGLLSWSKEYKNEKRISIR